MSAREIDRRGRGTVAPERNHSDDVAVVGIAGSRQSASVAVAVGGELRAFCEQARVTRIRRVSLTQGQLPTAALEQTLGTAELELSRIRTYVTSEDGVTLPASVAHTHLAHHFAHAATAYLTGPFDAAVVLVCDQHSTPPVTVWQGSDGELSDQEWQWRGPGFAQLYSEFSECFGFGPGQEHRIEALARIGRCEDSRLAPFIQYRDGSLHVAEHWTDFVHEEVQRDSTVEALSALAAEFQEHLGGCLLQFVSDIGERVGRQGICLAGGFFYNTYYATLVANSGLFESTFVPPNPGNPGTAAGAALALSRPAILPRRTPVPLFLGPEYSDHEIKFVLDNCKLTYRYVNEGALIDTAVTALERGLLVGWFQGRMEWGHRALGNRSILASPFSPHVLENLNRFLKQRESYMPYGVSVCEEDCADEFEGPERSRTMEFEYGPRHPERFAPVLHQGRTLRVQTVDADAGLFRTLHKAFGRRTGSGVLVNTSFNGFSEPIVCSPRDAVRVFFGTGIDLLVIGRFIVNK